MVKNKEAQDGMDASDVCWLSPPDIFETLLGYPGDKGYDEETLKKKFKTAKQFFCDNRPVSEE